MCYVKTVVHDGIHNIGTGIKIQDDKIDNGRFANNIDLIACRRKVLQESVFNQNKAGERQAWILEKQKSKHCNFERRMSREIVTMQMIRGEEIENATKFDY